MAAVAIGGFLVAAGVMADRHRWLWGAMAVWAAAIAAMSWLRGPEANGASHVHTTAVIVTVVMGPVVIGWCGARLVRRAREHGPEWDGPFTD